MLKALMKVLSLCVILCLSLAGCYSSQSDSSIIVISIEHLEFSDVRCGWPDQSESSESTRHLCQDFQRFTHLYSPSIDSLPSLASILTGLSPVEHQLHNQKTDSISTSIETTAEIAFKNGYKTALFSGGVPALSRSGLDQGFSVFDDQNNLEPYKLHRRAEEIEAAVTKWLNSNGNNRKIFLTLNYNDLLFPEEETVTSSGEVRNKSRESQLEETLSRLEIFFNVLSQHQLYSSSWIFVTGTGTTTSISSRQLTQLSQAHVAGFIKQPFQESPKNFDVDITLTEIGKFLKGIVQKNHSNLSFLELTELTDFSIESIQLINDHPQTHYLKFDFGKTRIESSGLKKMPKSNKSILPKEAPASSEYLRNPTLELVDIKILQKMEKVNFIWPRNESLEFLIPQQPKKKN